jgi:hypothetical protein
MIKCHMDYKLYVSYPTVEMEREFNVVLVYLNRGRPFCLNQFGKMYKGKSYFYVILSTVEFSKILCRNSAAVVASRAFSSYREQLKDVL